MCPIVDTSLTLVGARWEALEGFLLAPLDSRYTQFGFNNITVQVCYTGLDNKSNFPKINAVGGGLIMAFVAKLCMNNTSFHLAWFGPTFSDMGR